MRNSFFALRKNGYRKMNTGNADAMEQNAMAMWKPRERPSDAVRTVK